KDGVEVEEEWETEEEEAGGDAGIPLQGAAGAECPAGEHSGLGAAAAAGPRLHRQRNTRQPRASGGEIQPSTGEPLEHTHTHTHTHTRKLAALLETHKH